MYMRVSTSLWLCVSLASPMMAHAQLTGVVSDQIAQRRVPGAVVTVLDSARRVVVRALADDSGRFRIANAPAATRIRIVKIGYRPHEAAVASPATLRIALERLPSLLEPVLTSDQPRCPRNATRPAAFGLWEQARAALLSSVIARETNSAEVRRLKFRRYMAPKGDEIERQSVRWDVGLALRSFDALFPAAEFNKRGFAEDEGRNGIRFYGPDAEVLLDDAFVEGYCLDIANGRRDRPNQAGLRFRPMSRKIGRVDLDGILWIDTSARVLRDIEYRYLGLESWATPLRPGGAISFREMSPAILWIDQWMIRMTGAAIDTGKRDTLPRSLRRVTVDEGGAELVSARWPDGREWKAPLGSAELRLTAINGSPLRDARVQLDSTDYEGTTDSTGRLTLTELLPGPYTISVYDSALAVVDTTLPASVGFVAKRDSTSRVTARVPSAAQFISAECSRRDALGRESPFVLARIVKDDDTPMVGARWRLEPPVGTNDPNAAQGYYGYGTTGREGMVFWCSRLTRGRRLVLRVWKPDKVEAGYETVATVLLRDHITTLRMVLPP